MNGDSAKKIGKKIIWWSLLLGTLVFIVQYSVRFAMEMRNKDNLARYSKGSYLENNLVIKRECTVDNIVPKQETPTYIKAVPNLPIINTVLNCQGDDTITQLDPGEEIDARHRDFGPLREKENRCSYNYCGDSVPVGGEIDAVTRARFATDLAFPQFPFGVVVFYIIDDDGKLVDSGYIHHPGGIVHLTNKSSRHATLFSRYNIMKTYFEDKNYKIQVGWDGSTIAHEIVRQHPNIPTRQ